MSRATILVFLTAAVLAPASREDENKEKANMHISVGPKSFQRSASDEDSEGRVSANAALAQLRENLRSKPEERPREKPQEKPQALSQAELEAESLARDVSQASVGMTQLHHQSEDLRKAVADLTHDSGLDDAADRGNENKLSETENEEEKSKAKAKLQELAEEKERVSRLADDLDRQMHQQYADLLNAQADSAGKAAASLLQSQEFGDNVDTQNEEDKQFAVLEKQTEQIVHWFQQLKELRQARDHMRAQRVAAVKQAETVGITKEEVQKELSEPAPAKTDAKAAADAETAAKKQHLADVLASSAVEMAQIESASNDVMSGLEAFAKWKQRETGGDKSPESMREAAEVKAKLDKALKFLHDHEGMVDQRANEINALLKETGMGHL